jgi:hypothetical protein
MKKIDTELYKDLRSQLERAKFHDPVLNLPEEYWIKNTDIYCEILEYILSFIIKIDGDQRIKDENIKGLSIDSFRRGIGNVAALEREYNFLTYPMVDNLWSRITVIFHTRYKINATEKLIILKEHLNEEYEQYCRNRSISETNKAEIEEPLEKGNIYCNILNAFFESVEHIEAEELQDSEKILLINYFNYGLNTIFLIPGIEKIITSDIDKIDSLRKEVNKITQTTQINPETWSSFIEYLHREYTKNCVINEPITSKEVRDVSIVSLIFPADLIEKMRYSVIESINKNQIIEFKLCSNENVVHTEKICEKTIGYFRAIPETKYPMPKTEDIMLALNSIVCIGGINQIYCILRKGEYKEAFNKLQDMNKKAKELEEYEKRRKEFLDRDIRSGNMEVISIPLDIDKLKRLELGPLPGFQLGQYIVPINVVQRMIDTIIEGEESGVEIAFDLCANKNNFIRSANKISWEEARYVVPASQCANNEILAGTFHTHSHAQLKVDPSAADLLLTFEKAQCIGARSEIKCFVRHNFNENDYKYLKSIVDNIRDEVLKLDAERLEFLEKYFEFVQLI